MPSVIERGDGEAYMCNSRVCTGVLHTALANAGDPPDIVYERVMNGTEGDGAIRSRARTFAENGGRGRRRGWRPTARRWRPCRAAITGCRASLRSEEWAPAWIGKGTGRTSFSGSWSRSSKVPAGRSCAARKRVALVMEDGACRGVEVRDATGGRTIEAGAVVIADGGFQADRARLARHIAGRPDRIRQRNTETGRGDGLRMAEEAGAATVGLDKFYGHVLSRDVMTNPDLWPYPQVDVICASGIVVGADAKRFTDEGRGGVYIANEIARLDDPLGATAIFDSTVWEQAKRSRSGAAQPAMLVEAGGNAAHGRLDRRARAALPGSIRGLSKRPSRRLTLP